MLPDVVAVLVVDAVIATIDVVETTPFTVDVRIFVEVEKLILLVVDDAIKPVRDVVATTPFTVEVRLVPDVVKRFVVVVGDDVPEKVGGSHSGVPDAFIVSTVPDAPGVGSEDVEL